MSAQEEAAAEVEGESYAVRPRYSSRPHDHDPENTHMRTDDVRSRSAASGSGHWESASLGRRASIPKDRRRMRALPNRHREHGGLYENRFSGGLFDGGNADVKTRGTVNGREVEDGRASTAPHFNGRPPPTRNDRPRVSNAARVDASANGSSTKRRDTEPGVESIPDKAAALRVLDELLYDQRELEAFLEEEFARRELAGREGVDEITGDGRRPPLNRARVT